MPTYSRKKIYIYENENDDMRINENYATSFAIGAVDRVKIYFSWVINLGTIFTIFSPAS